MAGWTAVGGVLVTDTKAKNKCCWTGVHTAKCWVGRNKGQMIRYQNSKCSYLKSDAGSRNEKVVINTWRIETILGIRGFYVLLQYEKSGIV
jgi:hypothetical protein